MKRTGLVWSRGRGFGSLGFSVGAVSWWVIAEGDQPTPGDRSERSDDEPGPGDEPELDETEFELDYPIEPLLPCSGLTIVPRLGPFP